MPDMGRTVRGQVLDVAGNPVHNALVGLRRAEDAHERRLPDHSVPTGKCGDFRISGVRPGRYVIFANSRSHGTVLVADIEMQFAKELFITLRFEAALHGA